MMVKVVAAQMTNPSWQIRFNCGFVQRNAPMSQKKVALYFHLVCMLTEWIVKNVSQVLNSIPQISQLRGRL